jgi:hypothetical protein
VQLQVASFSIGLDISWLGFGLSDQSFCDVLSLGIDALLLVWLSSLGFASERNSQVKVKVLGGRLRPVVG